MGSTGTRPKALMVVEPRFATDHIGVRRVIANYWTRLRRHGFEVELGVISGGHLYRVSSSASEATYAIITGARRGVDLITWESSAPPAHQMQGRRALRSRAGPRGNYLLSAPDLEVHLEQECSTSEFDLSVLSNAWLCSQTMPADRFTHGIVYDLVPNLLAAQILDFGSPSFGVLEFANAHHRGYEYFLDHVSTILCISESTKRDFVRYYLPDRSIHVLVDIPFDIDDFLNEFTPPAVTTLDKEPAKVLLVNILDPRKNVAQVAAALASVSVNVPMEINVVGKERFADQSEALVYFRTMAAHGARVRWYRDASDELLRYLYSSAQVLVFPSLYEGLGLPLLEAQSFGTPVISGANSSLLEVNFNEMLFVDPSSSTDIATTVRTLLDGTLPVDRGHTLAALTRAYLDKNHRFEGNLNQLCAQMGSERAGDTSNED